MRAHATPYQLLKALHTSSLTASKPRKDAVRYVSFTLRRLQKSETDTEEFKVKELKQICLKIPLTLRLLYTPSVPALMRKIEQSWAEPGHK